MPLSTRKDHPHGVSCAHRVVLLRPPPHLSPPRTHHFETLAPGTRVTPTPRPRNRERTRCPRPRNPNPARPHSRSGGTFIRGDGRGTHRHSTPVPPHDDDEHSARHRTGRIHAHRPQNCIHPTRSPQSPWIFARSWPPPPGKCAGSAIPRFEWTHPAGSSSSPRTRQ